MLRIGTGGIPLTTKEKGIAAGIKRSRELGLEHMELEFVHGVKMDIEKAEEVRAVADEQQISLTVHGPYYVNFASSDNKVFYGSIKYIADSVYIGGLAGARSVTFHPGYYQKLSPKETYDNVKKGIRKLYEEFDKDKYMGHPIQNGDIKLSPELTGKQSQFGDLEELVSLSQEFTDKKLGFCFDFAHKFARSNGRFNSYDEVKKMIDYIATNLGEEFLQDMHIHVSAIKYSEKGERNHVTILSSFEEYSDFGVQVAGGDQIMSDLEEKGKNGGSDFNWKNLIKVTKRRRCRGCFGL